MQVDREPGSNEDGRRRTSTLIDLHQLFDAGRRLELDRETEEDLLYLEGRGTSLGGARPKCTLINEAGRLSRGKFASVADERDIAKGEILALRLAQSRGIASARGEVVMIGSPSVSVIERFDRVHESDEGTSKKEKPVGQALTWNFASCRDEKNGLMLYN